MAAETWDSLGFVTVANAGTPVRVTSGQANPAQVMPVHAIAFQQVKGNTGWIYVLKEGGSKTTGAGLLASLAPPTANTCPGYSATKTDAMAALNASAYFVDSDVDGEKCLVTIIQ